MGSEMCIRDRNERFERREPRPEDLATIDELRRTIREKDELVRRTYEEVQPPACIAWHLCKVHFPAAPSARISNKCAHQGHLCLPHR